MASLFHHTPHPRATQRVAEGPVKVADQHATGNPITRFNARLAIVVTKVVGSMWCAYAFAIMDFFSLPAAIRGGTAALIAWIAQTFLQLVLLSIIMVGQDVQAKAADARAQQTFLDTEAILHETRQLGEHLTAQDTVLTELRGSRP